MTAADRSETTRVGTDDPPEASGATLLSRATAPHTRLRVGHAGRIEVVDVGAETAAAGPWLPAGRAAQLRAAIILGMTAGCTAAVQTDWTSPVRVVVSLGFLLFGPGLAVAELLEIRDLAQRLMIAPAASLGIETLLAIALVYIGAFSIRLAVAILAAFTVASLGAALLRRSRRRGKTSSPDLPGA